VQNLIKTFTAIFIAFLCCWWVSILQYFFKFRLIYISELVHLYGCCSRHNTTVRRPF